LNPETLDINNTPDMKNVLETASFYDLNEYEASSIIYQIIEVARNWRSEAKKWVYPEQILNSWNQLFYPLNPLN